MCWLYKLTVEECTNVSVAGCLGYDVLVCHLEIFVVVIHVSVAGCLGYDVLVQGLVLSLGHILVSVAGCLGYDVLEK